MRFLLQKQAYFFRILNSSDKQQGNNDKTIDKLYKEAMNAEEEG